VPENKILVIRGGAIGDFILTLPVLSALRQQFPETRLELLGYPHIAQLALAGGLVDAVRSIEARALAGFFAQGGRLDPELADYFSSFALILSYLYDPDGIFQENIARIARTHSLPARIGPTTLATCTRRKFS
jgi:heptosyltransferase-2